jgi:hypothetical protein
VRHTIGASETAALKGAHAAMVIPTVPGSLRRWRIPAGLLSLLIVGSLAAPLTALAAITSVIVGAQVPGPGHRRQRRAARVGEDAVGGEGWHRPEAR